MSYTVLMIAEHVSLLIFALILPRCKYHYDEEIQCVR